MDSALRTSSAGLLGVVLGGGTAWLARPAPVELEVAAPVEVVLAAPLPVDCSGRSAVLDDERARLEQALESVRLQGRIVEHRRVSREGAESLWPDEPDPLLVPEVFEGHLKAALAEVDGELIGLECDEYPCFAAVVFANHYDGDGVPMSALDGVFGALDARGYEDHTAAYTMTGTQGSDFVAVFAVKGPDEKLSSRRTSFRGGRYGEEILASFREVPE